MSPTRCVKGQEIWKWPEFIALANRLEIPLDRVTELQINISRTDVVRYTVTRLAVDSEKKEQTTDEQSA